MFEATVVDILHPSELRALTNRKFVFGVSRDVNPLVDAGTVRSNGCPG